MPDADTPPSARRPQQSRRRTGRSPAQGSKGKRRQRSYHPTISGVDYDDYVWVVPPRSGVAGWGRTLQGVVRWDRQARRPLKSSEMQQR